MEHMYIVQAKCFPELLDLYRVYLIVRFVSRKSEVESELIDTVKYAEAILASDAEKMSQLFDIW